MATSPARKPADLRPLSVTLVSTFPPTRCGIGRFSACLCDAWRDSAPNTRVQVARIATTADPPSADPQVEIVFDPTSPMAARNVARRANSTDAVVLQHEYGLYGPDDGVAVLDLARRIEVPLVSVIHTVRPHPTPQQRKIIEDLGRLGTLVLLSGVARRQLLAAHDVDPSVVVVIPHGSLWSAADPPTGRRRRLISWGLLGPGKGIELALQAVARVDLDPEVTYHIVGQTHPKVMAASGQSYRRSLETLSGQLGLASRVRFVDRYVQDRELQRMVSAADLVLIPYDNDEQVCSGVLTDAIALGRPVIATPFPHAGELAAGCGRIVPRTPEAMAEAITELLTDDGEYLRACARARELGPSLSWAQVGATYLDLLHDVKAGTVLA